MLFTEEKANKKLAKGKDSEFYTIGLFLSPSTENSQGIDLCPFASDACRHACLNTSGLASVFPKIIEARKNKTEAFLSDRNGFIDNLVKDIAKSEKKAKKKGKTLAVRLNGTSDITWPNRIFESFPDVVFYDYTKNIHTIRKKAENRLPKNYHLTFSYSGENLEECKEALGLGVNVAVVFSSENFPSEFLGYPVTTGEESDLRFLDNPRQVIGLKAKGKAKKTESSFVIQIDRKES